MKHFKKEDTIMLLIDHQVGTINFATNRPKALARMAKALDIPVVLM